MFWSTQEDVAHEISLLEKVECLEVLPFTPVEAHYHWQQVLILLLYWYKSTNIDANIWSTGGIVENPWRDFECLLFPCAILNLYYLCVLLVRVFVYEFTAAVRAAAAAFYQRASPVLLVPKWGLCSPHKPSPAHTYIHKIKSGQGKSREKPANAPRLLLIVRPQIAFSMESNIFENSIVLRKKPAAGSAGGVLT